MHDLRKLMSSVIPSLKYSFSDESLMFAKGSTAMEVSGADTAWDVSAETFGTPGAVAVLFQYSIDPFKRLFDSNG